MANEINLNLGMYCTNGNFKLPLWQESLLATQNAIGFSGHVQLLTTTFEDLPLGDLTTLGYAMFKNLDATNNIEIGIDVTGSFTGVLLLKPTEVAIFRWKQGLIPAAKAVAGTPKLQWQILQD